MRYACERVDQLLKLRISVRSLPGRQIPQPAEVAGQFDDGTEYIGGSSGDFRRVSSGPEAVLMRGIIEREGCRPPERVDMETHYLYDQGRNETFSFDLPAVKYLMRKK